jgi:hypothetical protein
MEEIKVLNDTRDGLITAILKNCADDRLECGGHHLRCLIECPVCDEDALVDSEFVATTG